MKRSTFVLLCSSLLFSNVVFSATPIKQTSVEGITEYKLTNGMRLILFPDASKPTLTTNIIYKVGSRHENYGETGMAHLLEHLLFKPSTNFGVKKGTKTPVEVLNSTGADFNATTSYDRTNYYATFPANEDNLRQMLAMEADRMVNAAINQNDLWNPITKKGEMSVVRNEFEIGEGNPLRVTTERIQAVAYDWHNYGKSVIGTRSDIEQVNIHRLRAFYKKYYQPDNATLIVAGQFNETKLLKQVNELFGRIPKPRRLIAPTYTAEPTQDGERTVTVRRTGGTQFIGIGYHMAPSAHLDSLSSGLLSEILSSAPGGRLHKALVESKLATNVFFNDYSNLESGYGVFGAIVPRESNLDAAQAAMLKVLEELDSKPISEAELARAKQNFRKHYQLALNDTAQLTIALTESMAAGDWRLFFLQRDQLDHITLADIQASADKYFKATNRTIGRFIPTDTVDRTEIPVPPDVMSMVKNYQGRAAIAQGEAFVNSPENIDARTQRFSLENGFQAAFLGKRTKGGAVNIGLKLRMGNERSLREKAAVGNYVAALLDKGTESFTRQEIKDRFDELNAEVNLFGNAEGISVNITTTGDQLAATMDLIAEILKTPSFPVNEFEEFKRASINGIEQNIPEPQPLANNTMERLFDATPAGHVNHVGSFAEQIEADKAVKLEDVKTFHQQFYGSNNGTIAVVGEFDSEALKIQLNRLFGHWNAAQTYERIPNDIKKLSGQHIAINTPDKTSSVLLARHPLTMNDTAEEYPAMLIADYMLGGGALRSRLADRIREKDGYSYGVGSELSIPSEDRAAYWFAYAVSAPQNSEKVEIALREEIQRALREGFNRAELAEAKKAWLQSVEVSRTQDLGLANQLSSYLRLKRSMKYDREIETKVRALTLAQVNNVLRTFIKPEDISIIVAGDQSKFEK